MPSYLLHTSCSDQASAMPPQSTNDVPDRTKETPTSSHLLALVNLPPDSPPSERSDRMATLKAWAEQHPALMSKLLTCQKFRDKKTGCMALHWACGTGFDEAVEFLLNVSILDEIDSADDKEQPVAVASDHENRPPSKLTKLPVNQHAFHPSTSRTPLHYAARNGHLSTCHLLISKYDADPHPKCSRGAVTPLQLAVWQNRLSIVQFLVEVNSARGNQVVFERNGFNCGLMHWLGLVPAKRWGGDSFDGSECGDSSDDGSGVLPLARYLHSLGISYDSTPQNCNTQGHTPCHKAAWGGNLPLIQYFRDEHGVYDTLQDEAGNYCADIAKMRGNIEVHKWLLEHGSGDRAESYKILGLQDGADIDTVKRRYWDLAREHHPDKKSQQTVVDNCNYIHDTDTFMRIKAAYEHLTKENGVGKQKNPKYDELKLLENHHRCSSGVHDCDNEDLFVARLLAVISDYGDQGFPVSLISRRWNQIWPDRPFPTDYIIIETPTCKTPHAGRDASLRHIETVEKKVNLLKWLKWRCKGSDICFRNTETGVLLFHKIR
ncbi:hypothetical protein HJC23_002166 [Cyclotella cryptica]|uniref:J domain-containing protein n=1 Tax=Cyclotella cryptica TaxID=29204 RepID=A0ABD3Q6U3_9STRA|eukprot:CCRYP_008178-RA/>CCRYP_008178-RA protein AED:0.03 eAED:-0.03 QI:0/-1/0/1/-1/1/1/0/546